MKLKYDKLLSSFGFNCNLRPSSMVFQISYFQFINFLIIFVVLGIGADNVFVFMDAYHQSFGELMVGCCTCRCRFRVPHLTPRWHT